ncbi:MAG TPA: hypothetical protein VMO88_04770 [Acidimicrobiales bacterium]|nr:hypothetical protein [Acidimicrobiales bacterium]
MSSHIEALGTKEFADRLPERWIVVYNKHRQSHPSRVANCSIADNRDNPTTALGAA